MKAERLVVTWVLVAIFLMCSDRAEDWDIFEEMNTDMVISDHSSVGLGTDLVSAPSSAVVDSLRIELDITHEDYTNLGINLIHDTDTFLVWDNNYPGGVYECAVVYFEGVTVNGYWGISVCDSVLDGKEGRLRKFTLMIKYQ